MCIRDRGYSDCTAFIGSDELTVIARDTARVAGLTFNCAEGHLFTDKNLRCALYELIDADVCAQLMYGGYPETTETMCSTKAPWYVPNLDPDRAVDMDAAKEYLAAAGCPDGFEFTLLLEPDDAMRSVAEYLQSVFLEVGIKMNITNVEYGDFFQRLNDGDYDVQMTQSGHFIDPGPGAQTYDGRLNYVETDGGANVPDQKIYDLCDTIYSTVDEDELSAATEELTLSLIHISEPTRP